MSTLSAKIKAVNKIYSDLDKQQSGFQKKACISCVQNCGMCCTKPDISATVLEFLPAAQDLFIREAYEEILEKTNDPDNSVCVFYNPFSPDGSCSIYHHRGLICRLFGFSVNNDKYGNRKLISCKPIKETMDPELVNLHLESAPAAAPYYMRLSSIDPKLAMRHLPINQAIREALELVLLDSHFRKKPA